MKGAREAFLRHVEAVRAEEAAKAAAAAARARAEAEAAAAAEAEAARAEAAAAAEAAAEAAAARAAAARDAALVKESIVVNTEQEDKSGNPNILSFREAITKANESNADKIFINFEKTGSNSWHIKPETPLPAISANSNIYINHAYPKNITIDGSNLPSEDVARTYSLLTIGKYENIYSSSSNKPNVHLRHINLVNNTIKGESGSNGGGGGLAAGAGMSILQGDVVLENVVFQNLQAKGGLGSKSPNGAFASYKITSYGYRGHTKSEPNSPAIGGNGGSGGRPTLLGADAASTGGSGGRAGYWSSGRIAGGHGRNGNNGGFGVGGGGGGGGGGASMLLGGYGGFLWTQKLPNTYGDGGHGGNGGNGGFGAGGGAGGTGGENAFGKGRSQPGGTGGSGGSIHRSNPGSRGTSSKNTNGQGVASGASGGEGDALGAALAILNPSSNVELINVDLVNNKAISGNHTYDDLYAINANTRQGEITGKSVYIFESAFDNEGREFRYDQLINDADSHVKVKTSSHTKPASNNHTATSFNRDKGLAKIRNVEIEHRSGHADTTTIRWDKPDSTLRAINIDSSALEDSINSIYKRLLPIEDEDTIKNRFNERIISSVASAAISGGSSYFSAGNTFKASQSKYTIGDQERAIAFGAGAAGVGMLFSIMEAHNDYQKEIAQNKQNIEELSRLQKVDRGVTADPVDIGQSRNNITIKNFTIGEDTIYLNDFWAANPTKYVPIIRNGNGMKDNERVDTFEIHFSSDDNAATKIANVELDRVSAQRLNSGDQTDAVGYIQALLKPNEEKKQWEIGTTLTDKARIFQSSPLYTGGPAGELRILERQNLGNLTKPMTVDTFHYNDSIFGSKGYDYITTNGGNDFIQPSYGKDTVNAGESIDWVNYADLKEPIQAIGSLVHNSANQDMNTITVKNSANTDRKQILDATLENVEVISSFGASSFDLSAAPEPNPLRLAGTSEELPGFYAMRSGSGSSIEGSPFDDHIIISLMADENETGFDAIENLAGQSKTLNIYKNPAIIQGNGGKDKLVFAFEDTQNLEIIDPNFEGDRKGFKAIVNQGTIIALFKGIDNSRISVKDSSKDGNNSTIIINNDQLNIDYSFAKPSYNSTADTLDKDAISPSEANSTQPTTKIAYAGLPQTLTPQSETENPSEINDFLSGNQFLGNSRKNKLRGTSKNDAFDGRGGNDRLIGLAGNDIFFGGEGKNLIKPGKGEDVIFIDPEGIQVIKNFNNQKDILIFPENWKSQFLEFAEEEILYKNTQVVEFI